MRLVDVEGDAVIDPSTIHVDLGDIRLRSRNPHQVTKDFEEALCAYTGARYAVAVNSCTAALMLAVAWHLRDHSYADSLAYGGLRRPAEWFDRKEISIPKRTYVSVPQAIIHAGGRPVFRDQNWHAFYRLEPLPVWDCARCFTGDMYGSPGQFQCVSFHAAKILGDTQGGAILHDNAEADEWLRRARFDGRAEGVAPKDDHDLIIGYHCYISPDVSARLLNRLHFLPARNECLPPDDYPDLSTMECFK